MVLMRTRRSTRRLVENWQHSTPRRQPRVVNQEQGDSSSVSDLKAAFALLAEALRETAPKSPQKVSA